MGLEGIQPGQGASAGGAASFKGQIKTEIGVLKELTRTVMKGTDQSARKTANAGIKLRLGEAKKMHKSMSLGKRLFTRHGRQMGKALRAANKAVVSFNKQFPDSASAQLAKAGKLLDGFQSFESMSGQLAGAGLGAVSPQDMRETAQAAQAKVQEALTSIKSDLAQSAKEADTGVRFEAALKDLEQLQGKLAEMDMEGSEALQKDVSTLIQQCKDQLAPNAPFAETAPVLDSKLETIQAEFQLNLTTACKDNPTASKIVEDAVGPEGQDLPIGKKLRLALSDPQVRAEFKAKLAKQYMDENVDGFVLAQAARDGNPQALDELITKGNPSTGDLNIGKVEYQELVQEADKHKLDQLGAKIASGGALTEQEANDVGRVLKDNIGYQWTQIWDSPETFSLVSAIKEQHEPWDLDNIEFMREVKPLAALEFDLSDAAAIEKRCDEAFAKLTDGATEGQEGRHIGENYLMSGASFQGKAGFLIDEIGARFRAATPEGKLEIMKALDYGFTRAKDKVYPCKGMDEGFGALKTKLMRATQ